jgi:AcrR family transcriptional regulator
MSTDRKSRAEAARETTERLITAARAAFADKGFAEVSLDALAAEAGVTRGALHHHFTNKTGLFEAVLRRVDAEIGAEVQARWEPQADQWRCFQGCFHVYLDAILRPDRARIVFQDAPAVLGMKAVDILLDSGFGEVVAELDTFLAEGRIRGADAEALGHLINGATINLAFWAAEAPPDEDRLPRAHAALTALFDGLTATGAPG